MNKNPNLCLVAALLLLACGAAPALAQQPSLLDVPIVFDNQTGLDPSQIYIQFLGGHQISGTYTNIATGKGAPLSDAPSVSYSLAQLQGLGTYNATTNSKGVTSNYANAPGILVENLMSGRVYLNFGTAGLVNPTGAAGYTPSPELPTDPNYATRWQYFETTITNGQVYADLSYIDFTSISFGLNATNTPLSGQNTNQISKNGTTLVNATLGSATSNASSLPVAGAVLPNPQFARIISPQYQVNGNQTVYGKFTTYLNSLNGTSSTMSGRFVGVNGLLDLSATQEQIYDYTATFNGTVTTNGTVTLTANPNSGTGNYTGIDNAISGINPKGQYGVGDNTTITINYSDLIANTGIYGSNPPYQVSGTFTQNNTGIVNDVFGRVVGDLLAGLSFGTVGSTVTANLTIGNATTVNGTHTYPAVPIGDLPSSVWWAGGQGPNQQWIPIGNTLYSVDWTQSLAGSSNGTLLYGGAQPNSTVTTKENPFYNYYAAALVGPTNNFTTALTPGYGTPFGDRIGNNLLTFKVTQDSEGFMVLTINPDFGQGIPASLWTGGNGSSWSNPANWSSNNGTLANLIPADNSNIQFLGTPGGNATTVNVGGARDVAAISFRYGAQPFTLTNGTITLNGYQQDGFFPLGANIINSSLNNQTIQNDLVFTSNGTIAAVNGNLTLSGSTQLNNATLTNAGANKTATFSGNVSGNGGFVQSGNGTLALTGPANTFTGGVSLANGTVSIGSSGALGTGTVTLSGGTLAGQGSGNYTLTNNLVLSGNSTITGQGSLAFNGTTTVSTSATMTANAPVALNGAIGASGNNTANYTLTVAGNASLTLGGSTANTYNGSFAVTSGTLELAKTGNATSVFNNLTIGGDDLPATVLVSTANQIQLTSYSTGGGNFSSPAITFHPGSTLALGSNSLNLSTTTANTSASLIFYGGNVTGNGTISTFGNTATIQFLGTGNSTATINPNFSLQNSTLTGNLASPITSFNVFSNNAPVQLTVTGDISGVGGLSKADSGTLFLSGNNTYYGGTTLAGGVLAASSVGSGALVFSGGAISPGGLGQIANLTVTSAAFNSGFLLFDLAPGNSSDQLNLTVGNFTNSNNATVLFAFNSSNLTAGNFTYVLSNNLTSNGTFSYPLSYTSTNIPGLVGNFIANDTQVIFSGASGVNATWTGNTNGSWATGTNWQSSIFPASGADILFGNATNYAVDTAASRTTGSITFLAGAQAYTVSNNTITLGGDLTNNSAATQTVNSTIAINWDRSFNAASGNLVLTNLDLGTQNRVNTATFNATSNQTITVSGNITDEYLVTPSVPAGNILKTGAGTLLITGSAAHYGTTTIQQGILAASGQIGNFSIPAQLPTLIFAGGTLQALGNLTTSNTTGTPTRQAIVLNETAIFDTNGHTITLDSGITGPGGITKTGSGILVFTANAIPETLPSNLGNTNYQGMLTVNQGQVQMSNNQNLGANTNTVVTGNGSLVLNNFTGNVTNNFMLSGLGDPSLADGGALSISQANTNLTGNLTLQGASAITSGANNNITFLGNILTGNSSLGLNVLSSGTLNIDGTVSGNGGLTKNGNGTLNITGNNTYTGATTINAGTLSLISPSNIPSTAGGLWTIGNNATLNLAILVSGTQSPFDLKNNLSLSGNGSTAGGAANGAIYNTTGYNTISGSTTLAGNSWVYISSGSLTFAGPVAIGSNTLQITTPAGVGYIPAIISGPLSGNGAVSLSGSAQLKLSGDNSGFAGSFLFQNTGSTLLTAGNNALGTASQNITSGNTLALLGGITLNNTITAAGSIVNFSGDNFLPQLLSTGSQMIYSQSGTIHIGGNFSNTISVLNSGTAGFNGTVATIGSSLAINNLQIQDGYFSPGGAGTRQNLSLQSASWAGGTLVLDLASGNLSDTISLQNAVGPLTTGIFFNDDFGDQGFVGNQTYTIFSANTGNQVNAPSTFTSNIPGLAGTFGGANTLNITFTTVSTPSAATWTGNTSTQWNTGTNWSTTPNQPAAGAALTFTGNKNTSVDTIANQSTGTITFAPGAGNFTISNNTITVGGRITNNSGVTQTITSNLTYLGNGKSILAQSGDLVLGNIAMAPMTPQNLALSFNGSSNTTVNGAITQNQNGTASIVKNGTGTLSLSGNSTYTGATTVNSGTLLVTGALGSTPVTIASGAVLGGGGGSIGGNISFAAGSNYVFSNSSLSLTGPETVLTFGNFSVANILNLPSTTGNQSFQLLASNTGNVPQTTTLNLPAYINTANLQNPFSNKYILSDGRLAWFGGSNATVDFRGLSENLFLYITDGSTPPVPSSLYWVGSNGTSWLAAENWSASASATLGNATLATNGTQSVTFASAGANATTTAASVLNANATITGLTVTTSQPVSIGGNGILTISGNLATAIAVETTAGNVSITTPLVLAGTSTTISVNGTSPTVTIETIGGTNGLVKTGTGTLTLNGTSTYTGGTTISGGTLAISSSSITGNIANNAALAFNQTANGTFAGNISGTGSVTKNGTGTLTLNGTNTHSGTTTVNSGTLASGNLTNSTLVLQSGAAYSPGPVNTINTISVAGLTLNGGDLLYNLGNATSDRINASGNATLNGPVVFDFSNLGYAAGNFTVLTGTGVSSFNTGNLHFNAVGNFFVSGNFVVSGNTLLFVTAVPPPGTDYTWTGGAGNGNWTNSANWVNPPVVPSALVYFAGSNQTAVDTNTNQSVGGIVFHAGASAFTISNNTISLAGNVENDSTNTQTINSNITLAKNVLFAGDSGNLAFGGEISFGANSTFLTVSGSSNTAISGAITGNGSLLKRGTGNLTLSGINSYTGGTTVSAGTLATQGDERISDASALTVASGAAFQLGGNETLGSIAGAGAINLQSNSLTAGGDNSSTAFSGNITGLGSFAKYGSGTLTLSGNNSIYGDLSVREGNLDITDGTTEVGVGNVTVGKISSANATLSVGGSAKLNIYGNGLNIGEGTGESGVLLVSGNASLNIDSPFNVGTSGATGTVTQTGGNVWVNNTLALGDNGSYTLGGGNLTILGISLDGLSLSSSSSSFTFNGGTLLFGGSNATALNGGTTVINSGGGTINTDSGQANWQPDLSGIGSLTKTGNNTLTLLGNNTRTGTTVISAGTLAFDSAFTQSLPGAVSGSGALLKAGSGSLIITGNNTYTGGTTISAGTLAGNSDSLQGNITNNAVLAFNQTANGTFAGGISGSGSVTKNGSGSLTLNGTNTHSGPTSVTAGTLVVTGALGSTPVTIGNGATLGGTGTLGGNLTLAAGSNLAFDPVSSLAINGSSVSFGNFSLSNLTGFNGTSSAQGNFTVLGGSAKVNSANLNNYGASKAQTFGVNEAYFFTGVGGSTLNLAVIAAVTDIYWVGSNGTDWFAGNNWSNNASATTGDATFGPSTEDIHFASSGANSTTFASTNLSQNSTVRNLIVSTPQNVGVGGSGTLTLNGSVGTGIHLTPTAGNVTFTVPIVVSGRSDIQIDGGALEVASLNGTAVHIGTVAGTSFAYNAGSNLTFDGTITGAGAFAKRGNGTLTLSGINSYSGGTTISAGTLAGNSNSLQGNIANSGALVFNQSANGTYSGVLSGSGSLTKNGASTLVLTGINTNSGATLVNSGTLATQGDERLGNSSALTVASGATFQLGGDQTLGSIAGAGAINLQSAKTLWAGGDNSSTAFSGNITGPGSFAKYGSGTLTLSGNNSINGGLSVLEGKLDITGGTTDLNGGYVTVGKISSTNATLSVGGSATVNIYAYGFNIGEGTGESGVLLVSGNASLNIDSPFNVGTSGATGTVTQTGGNVWVNNTLALGDNGSYTLGGGNLTILGISLDGLSLSSSSSSFTFNGGTLLFGGSNATALNGGTTVINSGGGTINTDSGQANWQPDLSGIGSLTKTGNNTLTLLGNNTRTGTTVISAGTLAFDSAFTQSLPGAVSGSGALLKAGSGSLIITGNNTHTGGTTLAAGAIQALHANALGNGALTLSSGTLVLGNASTSIMLTGITDLAWASSNAVVSLANGGNISASGNFTNGGNAGNRTFDLGSGSNLQLGNNTLVSFGNTTFSAANFLASFSANHSHNGSFQIVGNSLVYNLSNGTATGNIIDNWAGPDTPTWVDFSVNGANGTVYSEVPIGRTENTIDGLIFSNSGNLVIQQNTTLNITGGVLNVANGTSLVTGGSLATPGNFNKTGAGELDVQNAVVVGGTASIDAGLLSVNGQLNANNVVVNTGGTLGGNGIIVAPGGMTIAGTLSPGNSPGVISIVSNPVWTSTATTLLEIASPTNYDRIVVSGTAQVAGTLNIVNFGGNDSLAYGQQYPFLTATGGISGDFDTITAPATFRGRFLNQGTTGTILIAPDTYTRVAVTPNQRRVAKALDSFILARSGDRETVSIALDLQTASQYPAAFDQITPGFYDSLPNIVIEQAYNQTQLLNQRMSSVRLGAQGFQYVGVKEQPLKNDKDGKSTADPKSASPILEGPAFTNWNAWVMGIGEFSNARGTSAPNYRNSAGGFLVGADYRLSENFSTGLFAGYQFNYAKYSGGGSNRGNSALFGLYGTYKNEEGYYADSVIGGGYSGFQTRRPIKFSTINRTARANPGTGQFNAAINLGKDWTIDKFVVGPLLGLQYTYAGTPAFTEQGADSLDLAVGSQNTSSLRSSLGGRVAYLWDVAQGVTLIPEVRAQWMHEFLNNSQTLTSSLDGGSGPSFGYATAAPYRDSLFGGVGVTAKFGEQWSGSLFYNVNFGNNEFTNNIISADLNISF